VAREKRMTDVQTPMRPRLATVWLDGCSGCHMSVLDMDERILEILSEMSLVYSPLVDAKEFPENVDLTLVEGSVSSEEDLHKITLVRQRTKTLVALGDCAVTSNVPGMRNPYLVKDVLDRAYTENADGPRKGEIPKDGVPRLLPWVRPVHEIVKVDVFLPGCPPPADVIYQMLTALKQGDSAESAVRMAEAVGSLSRFGK
jgi:NAD-reducing hydrogenase small subunit